MINSNTQMKCPQDEVTSQIETQSTTQQETAAMLQ